jgi:hypothetical protein
MTPSGFLENIYRHIEEKGRALVKRFLCHEGNRLAVMAITLSFG